MRERPLSRPGHYLLLGLVLLYATLIIGIPIVALFQKTLSAGIPAILDSLNKPDITLAFQLTAWLAAITLVINTIGGLILAWVLVRHNFRGQRFLDSLVDTPFVFSPVIVGYVLIVLFGRNGWFQPQNFQIVFAPPAMLLASVFVTLPFVTRAVQPVLMALTSEQEEAAMTTGASRPLIFWRIVVPQISTGLLYGIALTLVRAIGDFGAVAVAGGSIERVTESATVYLYRALYDRNQTSAYSVAVVLMVVSTVLLVVMSRLHRRVFGQAVQA